MLHHPFVPLPGLDRPGEHLGKIDLTKSLKLRGIMAQHVQNRPTLGLDLSKLRQLEPVNAGHRVHASPRLRARSAYRPIWAMVNSYMSVSPP